MVRLIGLGFMAKCGEYNIRNAVQEIINLHMPRYTVSIPKGVGVALEREYYCCREEMLAQHFSQRVIFPIVSSYFPSYLSSSFLSHDNTLRLFQNNRKQTVTYLRVFFIIIEYRDLFFYFSKFMKKK